MRSPHKNVQHKGHEGHRGKAVLFISFNLTALLHRERLPSHGGQPFTCPDALTERNDHPRAARPRARALRPAAGRGIEAKAETRNVYVTLGRMQDKGYITSRLEDSPPGAGGMPRRLYQATALGRRVLRVWTSVAERLVPELAR